MFSLKIAMEHHDNDATSLLPVHSTKRKANTNFKQCCVKSRSVLIILLLNVSILLAQSVLFDVRIILVSFYRTLKTYVAIAVFVFIVTSFFSPMVGLLTDIRFGRYRSILYSSYCIFPGFALYILALICVILSLVYIRSASLPIGIIGFLLGLPLLFCFATFTVNGIQFRMDQLHDSPTQDLVIYIHWYVWIYYLSALIAKFACMAVIIL